MFISYLFYEKDLPAKKTILQCLLILLKHNVDTFLRNFSKQQQHYWENTIWLQRSDKAYISSTMNEAIFWNVYWTFFPFMNNLLQFYLNVRYVWVIVSFLFMFPYFLIRYLGTLALAAITWDIVLWIILDQGY